MANRRMIAKDVVTSGEFIEMSLPAQAMYFQLNLQADDDGFVDCLMVKRMLGLNDDVLDELTDAGFLTKIPDVKKKNLYHIRHWRKHNSIDKSKYGKSDYYSVLQDIYPDYDDYQNVLPNWERDKKTDGNTKFPESSQEVPDLGEQKVPNLGTQDRLGKDRLGQGRQDKFSLVQNRVTQSSMIGGMGGRGTNAAYDYDEDDDDELPFDF